MSRVFVGGCFFLVFVALVGTLLWAFDLPRPFYVHGVFVLAALPLMWAAMLHFIPVLTRSRDVPRALLAMPWLAMLVALGLLAGFAGVLPRHALLLPALLFAAGAAILLGWAARRGRQALGKPHPGLRWYLAALACLLGGLVAAFGMVLDVRHYAAWYVAHLHLNLLGWVGLTVLGTLPVLLPTCLSLRTPLAGKAPLPTGNEPNAAARLARGLPWALAGVLAIALSAVGRWPWLGAAGALALMVLIAAHWRAWQKFYGTPQRWPGPAVSLLLGSGFLFVLLALGVVHGAGHFAGARLLPALVAGFLLPTVLGALAQLLPVWRFPGPDSPARQAFRLALARGAAARGGLCLLAGLGQLLALPPSLALAGIAVLWLLVDVLLALWPGEAEPPAGL